MSAVATELVAGGTVMTVSLSAPATGNALSAPMVEELHEVIDTATQNGTRVLLIEAEGKAFCAGLNLEDLETETDASLLHRLVRIELLLEKLWWGPVISMAVVDGAAAGAGADLVMATTVRYGTRAASLRFPGSEFGAVLGTRRLSECTTPAFAGEVAATGRVIGAEEAARAGIWTLLEDDSERPDPERLAKGVSRRSPETVASIQQVAGALTGAGADPMGDLVRSLAARPGLAGRIKAMNERRLQGRKAKA